MGEWGKVTVLQICLFFIMLLGSICCMVLKNVVVVEGGLKLWGKNIANLVSPYTYFKGDLDYKL